MAKRAAKGPTGVVRRGFAAIRLIGGTETIDITSFNTEEAAARAVAEARDRAEFARLRASDRRAHQNYVRIAPVTITEG